MAAGAADEGKAEDEVFVARVAAALGSLGQMQAGVLARLQAVARDLGRWVAPRGRGAVTHSWWGSLLHADRLAGTLGLGWLLFALLQ